MLSRGPRAARRARVRITLGALVLLAATACSDTGDDAAPPPSDPDATATTITAYDDQLAPAVGVLTFVPEQADSLAVTDYDRLGDRTAPVLTEPVLAPVGDQLQTYGFGQADVSWEATFTGGADGFVLRLDDDVDMSEVQSAVDAGVGPLAGAVVSVPDRLVGRGVTGDAAASWSADETLVALADAPGAGTAATTALRRGCLPFTTVFDPVQQDQLATGPAADLESLDPLDAFALTMGPSVATVQLGDDRADTFDRLHLDEVMPRTDPDFDRVFTNGVADPAGGRIGYQVADPAAAATLVQQDRLPFAVCAD